MKPGEQSMNSQTMNEQRTNSQQVRNKKMTKRRKNVHFCSNMFIYAKIDVAKMNRMDNSSSKLILNAPKCT